MEIFKNLILNPFVEIKKAKRKKDINKVFLVSIVNSIFLFFAVCIFFPLIKNILIISFLISFLNIIFLIFLGFLTYLTLFILSKKGSFYEGFTSIVYAEFPICLALLLSTIFLYIPAIGIVLSLILMGLFSVIGISIFFSSVKELFGVDLIAIWITVGIVSLSLIIALYSVAILLALKQPEVFPTLIIK